MYVYMYINIKNRNIFFQLYPSFSELEHQCIGGISAH